MISIIVPVYNAELTIQRCIDSICTQTFSDYELILINDGSCDSSGDICDKYAESDSRIVVIHKENEGVSSARNAGLKYARGEWVTFVDADDEVAPCYLDNLISNGADGVDLVISYSTIVDQNGQIVTIENYPSETVSNDTFSVMFEKYDMNWHTAPWSKLFRRSLIADNNLRFCEQMHIGEDALFLYSYFLVSKQIKIVGNADYLYYAYNNASLTKRVNSVDSELLSYNKIYEVVDKLISMKGIQEEAAVSKLMWVKGYYSRRVLNSLYHSPLAWSARINLLRSIDFVPYTTYLTISSLKEKILCVCLKMRFLIVYDFIRSIAKRFR